MDTTLWYYTKTQQVYFSKVSCNELCKLGTLLRKCKPKKKVNHVYVLLWKYFWPPRPSEFLFRTPGVSIRSDQSISCVQLFATPWITARQASLSITNSRSSLRLTSIESVMPSSHLILCRPLLPLPPIPPSIRVLSNESTLHEVAKVLEFQL